MIIIPDKNKITHVYAPKIIHSDTLNVLMELTPQTSEGIVNIELVDVSEVEDCFEFYIDARSFNLNNQEYNYKLFDYIKITDETENPPYYIKEKYLGCGLLRIGDYKDERVYEANNTKNDTKIDLL